MAFDERTLENRETGGKDAGIRTHSYPRRQLGAVSSRERCPDSRAKVTEGGGDINRSSTILVDDR